MQNLNPIGAIKGITSTVIAPLQNLNLLDPSEVLLAADEEPLVLPVTQLEALADAFQERLIQSGKVQDRQLRNRPAPQSFQGNEAVDVLVELLQEEDATRAQAVQVGREIQAKFNFFVNNLSTLNHSIPLRDSEHELYQFDWNLPLQVVKQRKLYPSNWDKVTLLENRVPLVDHSGLLKDYQNTFEGREAVDVLMQAKLVKNRKEAVHMIRKLNEKVHCCRMADHPGNDGTNFVDDTTLYRFVPKEDRIKPTTSTSGSQSHARQRSKSPRRKNNDKDEKSRSKTPPKQRPLSPAKDAAYFKSRAQGVRDRLDAHRQQRAVSPTPQAQTNYSTK